MTEALRIGTGLPGPGRPSLYSEELAERICSGLKEGKTLRAVCREPGMPDARTVRDWAANKDHPFSPQYTRAREIGYHAMADELLEIADDDSGDVTVDGEGNERLNGEFAARSRLRVDTRKWLLSKALPKIYGDRTEHRHAGPNGEDLPAALDSNADARMVAFMLGRAIGRQEKAADEKIDS